MGIQIGISKASGSPKYARYINWIAGAGDDIEIVDLYASDNREADLEHIDGLLLTGGPDIDPLRYQSPELSSVCIDIDRVRDAAEFGMLEIAEKRELPVLAVCRGVQLVNVYYGGSLIPHLPDVLDGAATHAKDGEIDRRHSIEVTPGSLLFKAAGELAGEVNSAHHQAAGDIAPGMVASARAGDGVIEALEWNDPTQHPYLLGVQWHPERMELENPFSIGVRDQFIFEVRSAVILARSGNAVQ